MLLLIGPVYAGSCLGLADCRANRPGLNQAAMNRKNSSEVDSESSGVDEISDGEGL